MNAPWKPVHGNRDPFAAGWMLKLRLTKPEEKAGLMDAAAYGKHTAN